MEFKDVLALASFAMWLLMNLMLVVVPRYGAYSMMVTGVLLVSTDLVYYSLLPLNPLVVRFEGSTLTFSLGWCFWLVLMAGVLCLTAGLVIAVVDLVYPHRFSTILEVDYDTPYDRHIIIEESHDTRRNNKKNVGGNRLEEPPAAGIGTKILRRLSKREQLKECHGLDNEGFELDPPKSPWRYPFQRNMLVPGEGRPPSRLAGIRPGGVGLVGGKVQTGGLATFSRSMSQDSGSSCGTGSSGDSSIGPVVPQQGGGTSPPARRPCPRFQTYHDVIYMGERNVCLPEAIIYRFFLAIDGDWGSASILWSDEVVHGDGYALCGKIPAP
uniref:Uncharacterized protein n=1 Tax=Timema cristinae TaxID=61476 RepID=A0A7R9GXK4_TIMCR|nr:unnamed protein product [Timema cristinae]